MGRGQRPVPVLCLQGEGFDLVSLVQERFAGSDFASENAFIMMTISMVLQ